MLGEGRRQSGQGQALRRVRLVWVVGVGQGRRGRCLYELRRVPLRGVVAAETQRPRSERRCAASSRPRSKLATSRSPKRSRSICGRLEALAPPAPESSVQSKTPSSKRRADARRPKMRAPLRIYQLALSRERAGSSRRYWRGSRRRNPSRTRHVNSATPPKRSVRSSRPKPVRLWKAPRPRPREASRVATRQRRHECLLPTSTRRTP